jgi:hypothetical protein
MKLFEKEGKWQEVRNDKYLLVFEKHALVNESQAKILDVPMTSGDKTTRVVMQVSYDKDKKKRENWFGYYQTHLPKHAGAIPESETQMGLSFNPLIDYPQLYSEYKQGIKKLDEELKEKIQEKKESSEHPWATKKQIKRIVEDHEKKEAYA